MFWTEVNGERGRELLCVETGARIMDVVSEAAQWSSGTRAGDLSQQRLNVDYQTVWQQINATGRLIKRFN